MTSDARHSALPSEPTPTDRTVRVEETPHALALIRPRGRSLRAALEQWLAKLAAEGRSEQYRREAKKGVLDAARACRWQRASDMEPEAATAYLQAYGGKGKTRNNIRGHLRAFSRWCKLAGVTKRHRLRNIPKFAQTDSALRYVPTTAEVAKLIAYVRGQPRKKDRWALYLIESSVNLRNGTAIDLLRENCRVDADPPYIALHAHQLKGRKAAKVWLTAEAAETIRELLRVAPPEPTARIFRTTGVKWEGWLSDLKGAGLAHDHGPEGTFTMHSLRHFASNRLKWQGFTDQERAAQNTHSDVRMTAEVYTRDSHVELGRKIFALPGLLQVQDSPGVAPEGDRILRESSPEHLTRVGGSTDTDLCDVRNSSSNQVTAHGLAARPAGERHNSSKALPSGDVLGRAAEPCVAPPPPSPAGGEQQADKVRVTGFEPDTPRIADLLRANLDLAENAIRTARLALDLADGSRGAARVPLPRCPSSPGH